MDTESMPVNPTVCCPREAQTLALILRGAAPYVPVGGDTPEAVAERVRAVVHGLRSHWVRMFYAQSPNVAAHMEIALQIIEGALNGYDPVSTLNPSMYEWDGHNVRPIQPRLVLKAWD